jgi:CheY-like chemotaxis protein
MIKLDVCMHPMDDPGIVKLETLFCISQCPANPLLICHPVADYPRASGQEGSKMSLSIVEPPTVLVVEDEPLILVSTVMDVEDAGYLAIGVANAVEARLALQRYPRIAALVTDVHLAGSINGIALAHEARRLSPRIKILVVSGIAQPSIGDLPNGARFLEKPFMSQQIAENLNQLMKLTAA